MKKVYEKLGLILWLLFYSLPTFSINSSKFDTPLVNIDLTDVQINAVFKEIERQTGYVVFYSKSTLDGTRKIKFKVVNESLDRTLMLLLKGTLVEWIYKGKAIVLVHANRSRESGILDVMFNRFDSLPNRVKGIVYAEEGGPLSNATVLLKGTPLGTVTNSEGEFEIDLINGRRVLLFTLIGYQSSEQKISSPEVKVYLKKRITELNNVEIVSTGYQDIAKDRITGSAVKISNELFNRQPGRNVIERIYNVTSGLINDPLSNSEGQMNLMIRGRSTYEGNGRPLIVVDNFPYEGSIDDLNPNDVESISVLKDAAASAIWGTRAGNGVIVITTKRGKYNGKLSVNFNANYSISELPKLDYLRLASSRSILEHEKDVFKNGGYNVYDDVYAEGGLFPVLPQAAEVLLAARREGIRDPLNDPKVIAQLDKLSRSDIRDDITNYMLQRASLQQYSVSISGGTNNLSYYSSVGFDGNRYDRKNTDGNRFTVTAGSTFRIVKPLEFGFQIVHSRSQSNSLGPNYKNLISNLGVSPYTRLVDEMGKPVPIPRDYRTSYVDTAIYPGLLDWKYIPLNEYDYTSSKSKGSTTRLSGNLVYTILPWLKASFQYQGEFGNIESIDDKTINSFEVRDGINSLMSVENGVTVYPWPLGGTRSLLSTTLESWNARGAIAINKVLGEFKLNGLAGMEFRQNEAGYITNKLYGFDVNTYTSQPVNGITTYTTRPNGSTIQLINVPVQGGTLYRFGSLFSEFYGSFRDKYILSISGRVDQSNNFGMKANLRRIPLLSTGFNWSVNEESWYDLKWLPNLRFRASYGYSGNTIFGVTSFATMQYTNRDLAVPGRGDPLYGVILTPNNPGIKWERVRTLNIGAEFGLKSRRLFGSFEYYKKDGLDLIGDMMIDPTSGFISYKGNNARIKGKGIDVSLESRNVVVDDFEWTSRFIFSSGKSVVKKNISLAPLTAFGLLGGGIPKEGEELNSLYSFKSAGLDPNTGDPRIYLGDTISNFINSTQANISDLRYHGIQNPRIYGSLINNFRWKNISVSCNLLYQFGHYFRRPSINYNSSFSNLSKSMAHIDYEFRWKSKGDEFHTNVPSMPLVFDALRDQAYQYSDVLVEKADHVRLKDIRVSWLLDGSWIKKYRVRNLSLYLYVDNVGIIYKANKSGIDPLAYSNLSLPPVRSYTFGLNVNL